MKTRATKKRSVKVKVKSHWSDVLKPLDPCPEGMIYAKTQPSLKKAWETCFQAMWLSWLLRCVWDGKGDCPCCDDAALKYEYDPDGLRKVRKCPTMKALRDAGKGRGYSERLDGGDNDADFDY